MSVLNKLVAFVLANVILIGLSKPSFAQDNTLYFSLNEVIRLAQEQSPDALIAKHRFRRSYWDYRSFKAGYLPNLSLDATLPNYNRSIDAITQADGSEEYRERQVARYSANLSLNQKIGLTGGEIFLNSGLERIDNYFTDTATNKLLSANQFLSTPVNIGFRQPIFGYNSFKWEKKIQPMVYEEARREYLESRESIATTAVNHFFNLLMAQVEVSIAAKNQSNYDTLYNIARGRYTLGKIAENELLQLELNLLRSNAAMENADLNYQNMLFTFKSYLRMKSSKPFILIPPAGTFHFEVAVDQAVQEAQLNTSTGLAFERRLMVAESDLSMAKLEGRFDAELYATYGLTQSSKSFDNVYRNPLDEQRVSLGISIPILDWGQARGKIKMAESSLELIRTSIEQERLDFEQDIFLNVMQFMMQKNQLMIAAKADTVAQKRFDVTQKRYMIGKVNDVLELKNAQIDNDNAKIGYYSALKTYWNSFYELRRSTLFDFRDNRRLQVNPDELVR